MKFDLEKHIIDKVSSGEWRENYKLPSEIELISMTNLSKMTIRKIIAKLTNMEYLYSIKGFGVFVSPFYQHSLIQKFSQKVNADKVELIEDEDLELPDFFEERFDGSLNMNRASSHSYIKKYWRDDRVIGYTLNWLNDMCGEYSTKQVKDGDFDIYCENAFSQIVNIQKMTRVTKNDIDWLEMTCDFAPTTYSYYLGENREILLLRVSKMRPTAYETFEVKKLHNNPGRNITKGRDSSVKKESVCSIVKEK